MARVRRGDRRHHLGMHSGIVVASKVASHGSSASAAHPKGAIVARRSWLGKKAPVPARWPVGLLPLQRRGGRPSARSVEWPWRATNERPPRARLAPGLQLSLSMSGYPRVRVGISGWNYPHWRGVFYPKGLRQADELRFASREFSTTRAQPARSIR